MLPLYLFRNGVFSAALAVAMVTTLIFFGLIFVLSLWFQQVRGYSPALTGIAFLPLTAVVTAVNIVSGRWTKARGPSGPVAAGLICSLTGFVGMLLLPPAPSYQLMAFPLVTIGIGGGLTTPAVTAALMKSVAQRHTGIASGVLNASRQTGAALGVAIFGVLAQVFSPIDKGIEAISCTAAVLSLVGLSVWLLATGALFHRNVNGKK